MHFCEVPTALSLKNVSTDMRKLKLQGNVKTLGDTTFTCQKILAKKPLKKDLLCLNCRTPGHLLRDCPHEFSHNGEGWFRSPRRRQMTYASTSSHLQSICRRCAKLELATWLHEDIPVQGKQDLYDLHSDGALFDERVGKNFGNVGKIVLRQDCTICWTLFGLIPTAQTTDQNVILVKSWSIYRLEGSILADTAERRNMSQYVTAILSSNTDGSISFQDTVDKGDGLCLIGMGESKTTLAARPVDSRHIGIQRVESWLSTCGELHPVTCNINQDENVKLITLIDVESRKLVSFPPGGCEYLALSYVWGDADQQVSGAGVSGTRLGKLAKTIEDAMTFVKMLGKRYLWVDSVCIQQENHAEKLAQIGIMSSIYRGSYLTIIALSGSSADAGLPGVGADHPRWNQLSCSVDGEQLLGVGPNLSQLIWVEPWGRRAWTLQEAILSPRCVYISDYQAYFECNSMQCCESLNDTTSPVHLLRRDAAFLSSRHDETMIGTGVLRDPFAPNYPETNALMHYSIILTLYSYRSLTQNSDGINAFAGITQFLQGKHYNEGFLWGMPKQDLPWALLWKGRFFEKKRKQFPTWSWAYWGGYLWPTKPDDNPSVITYPVDLRMWNWMNGEAELIYESVFEDGGIKNDPLAVDVPEDIYNTDTSGLRLLRSAPEGKANRMLCIDAVTLSFDWPELHEVEYDSIQMVQAWFWIGNVAIWMSMPQTAQPLHYWDPAERPMFVLLLRQVGEWYVRLHFLLLQKKGKYLKRIGTVEMQVRIEDLEVLSEMGMRRRQVVVV
ncbi:MAG: hypothetical protein M1820_008745 [Bogoriella megaspora]|nr:MAG: hypothetical protein M1820_008745 [Bogoriella megaspora]